MEFQKKKGHMARCAQSRFPGARGSPCLRPGQAWKRWSPQHWVPRSHVPLEEACFDELPEKCRFGGGDTQGKPRVTVAFVSGQDLLSWVFPVPMDFLGSSGIFPCLSCLFCFEEWPRLEECGPAGRWRVGSPADCGSDAAVTEGTP